MNYDKIIATAAQEMRASGIRKFFDIAAEMKDCISLGVGEPDFKTRPALWPALRPGQSGSGDGGRQRSH